MSAVFDGDTPVAVVDAPAAAVAADAPGPLSSPVNLRRVIAVVVEMHFRLPSTPCNLFTLFRNNCIHFPLFDPIMSHTDAVHTTGLISVVGPSDPFTVGHKTEKNTRKFGCSFTYSENSDSTLLHSDDHFFLNH